MYNRTRSGQLLLAGIVLTIAGISPEAWTQDLPAPAKEIALYEGTAPGSEQWDWTENTATTESGLPMIQNVVKPVLLYYPPDPSKATRTAMVVAPGGGTVTS